MGLESVVSSEEEIIEWEYVEGHKHFFNDVMKENRPPLTSPDGSSNGNPPERCPRPLYSRDSTQEHQEIPREDQNEYVIKVEVKEEAEMLYVRGDDPHKEEEIPPEISTDPGDTLRNVNAEEEGRVRVKEEKISIEISKDGPSNSNTPERCPSSLYYGDSTQEGHRILQDCEDEKVIKVEVKMEDEEETDGDDDLCKEDDILSEITTDGRYREYSTERALAISPDGEIEDYDVSSESSEEDLVTPTLHSRLRRADLSFDHSGQGKNCSSHSPPLSNHKSANGDGTFSCTECEKNFTVRAKLIKHQRTHSAEKPFSCSECGKSFRQKCLLRRHQARHNSDKPFSCSECGKSFVQKSDIVRHQRTHTGEKPFSCSECGKSFARKHYLNTHEKVHSGEKPYSCSECGKCFSRKSYLNTHEKVHTGEKPFSCSECGKCFADRYRLVTHHRVHTGDRPYTCTECGRSFAQSSDLIRHRKVHTGERPYSCSECGRGFINKSDLIIHERIHTGDQPYSCSECGKRFSHKSTLKSHLGTHR